ncbi:mitochondrial protein-like protein Fmp25 [Mollisia scopiformis]|uniref:Mitochondrial protein-like protein Fmp25 n=1 Tax=Mollisia scopiformis TaxID=149040 RepID=A0A194X3X6_MOLSC|nr:mitochondrial protein-like protein Fmp25 [Mollisia scopiformis]KUJ14749.1 mitochondrial protein-like protein Fmp25 [Mollisia scopiformis]
MFSSGAAARQLSRACWRSRGQVLSTRRCLSQSQARIAGVRKKSGRNSGIITALLVSGGCLYALGYPRSLEAEAIPAPAEIKFEEPRKKATSREDNRDLISSQHLQVKKSWENPGVYAWGSNAGRVAAPDSDEQFIKTPRRIPYFDGKIIRDIKLDKTFGAAITENGDLLQWGTGFSPTSQGPTPTVRGKDLIKISISKDRIIALSSNGTVYSIPAIQEDQISGPKPLENTWFPFWKNRSAISYRKLQPSNMSWSEKVVDVRSGLEHCLILTSSGRVFSAASGTEDFPSKGQLGVPGLTWTTRPEGAYDVPHEISTLKGFEIIKIAAGDFHSLAVDKVGRVFTFGDNSVGQLGFEATPESPYIDAPSLLPIDKLYKGTNMVPQVIDVAAGGVNSYFSIDATRVAGQSEEDPRGLGRVTADTWACGQGIWGGLGNGRWTHVQGVPTKIKALSGLFEYDETTNKVVPIRLAHLSVGSTHMSAIMSNVTYVGAHDKSSENDTNWGADTLFWGGNEFYQLGTGKRNNVSNPTYIAPLDIEADKEKGRREEHRFQITPRKTIKVGGRKVSVEQRVECGRGVTAVYSGT